MGSRAKKHSIYNVTAQLMEKIIDPVDISLIKAELTPDKKLMDSNKGHNELYVVTYHDSPNTMREIARLRERSFRLAGGATGKSMDMDEYDTMEVPYKQLLVWDPDAEAIIGGYRYIIGSEVGFEANGQPILASSHQFHFSEEFIHDYLPHVMELGRSFVAPEYQSSKAGAKAIFAMDNLWDGITSLVYKHPNIIYFFGKVTMYQSLDRISRDLILHYMWKHFGDKEQLVTPISPILPESDPALMDLILKHEDVKEDYKLLKEAVRSRKTNIPPLVNSYLTVTPKMTMLGTAPNELMPGIEDTAILMCFNDLYEDKKARHIDSYKRYKLSQLRKRYPLLNSEIEDKLVSRWEFQIKRIQEGVADKVAKLRKRRKEGPQKS